MLNKKSQATRAIFCTIACCILSLYGHAQSPSKEDVETSMLKATQFMFDTLANQNGFVWFYTQDFQPYGELKPRPSMIWVEPPGTPSVGLVLLNAYEATGNNYYLEQARKVADTLAAGQHPSGGWNYFIDFDPEGLQAYYDDFFSKCWGWQEYLKNRGNCTFDDYSTTEPTRFFLRLYSITKDKKHKKTLDRALTHILKAQYKNGAWPQRYPVEKSGPNYTQACTFNDDVILDCINVLWEAADTLDKNKYRKAALRGMQFYIDAQLPAPQAGWPQQCDQDYTPVYSRPFEIDTVSLQQTTTNILDLFYFFKRTGDKKYLAPIPAALDWIEASAIPGATDHTHTNFYEMGTNRPLYIQQTGTTIDDVHYTESYELEGAYPYAHKMRPDIKGMRRVYNELLSLSPEEAKVMFQHERSTKPLPENIIGGYMAVALARTARSPEGIQAILEEQDERGAWIDPATVLDPYSPFTEAPSQYQAHTVGGYLARMYRMIDYLGSL